MARENGCAITDSAVRAFHALAVLENFVPVAGCAEGPFAALIWRIAGSLEPWLAHTVGT